MNVDLCIWKFSATKTVTSKFHVDDSVEGRYNVILGRDLLTTLVLDIKFSDNVIIGVDVPFEG